MDKYNSYGLKLLNILSHTEVSVQKIKSYEVMKKIFNYYNIKKGYVVAYLNYKVKIGLLKDGKMFFYNSKKFNPKFLLRLRVFNRNKEILIWKEDDDLYNVRYRKDGVGKAIDVIQADQVLWGTKSESLENDWIKLYEKRGIKLILPKPQRCLYKYGDIRIKIRTRNYVGYNELGQAGYVDSRFVDFVV